MPLVDMPLASLLEYKGRNPRPADFDAYWDASIRELDATPAHPEFAPAAFSVPGATCLDLTFRGVGNASIYAKCVKPANLKAGQKVPAVCMFHGYSGHSGDWMDKLGYASAGMVVLAMDVRGQGGRSQDSGSVRGTTLNGHIVRGVDDPDPTKLFYRSVYLDCAQLARVALAMPEVDASRVYATGWSQGGVLSP